MSVQLSPAVLSTSPESPRTVADELFRAGGLYAEQHDVKVRAVDGGALSVVRFLRDELSVAVAQPELGLKADAPKRSWQDRASKGIRPQAVLGKQLDDDDASIDDGAAVDRPESDAQKPVSSANGAGLRVICLTVESEGDAGGVSLVTSGVNVRIGCPEELARQAGSDSSSDVTVSDQFSVEVTPANAETWVPGRPAYVFFLTEKAAGDLVRSSGRKEVSIGGPDFAGEIEHVMRLSSDDDAGRFEQAIETLARFHTLELLPDPPPRNDVAEEKNAGENVGQLSCRLQFKSKLPTLTDYAQAVGPVACLLVLGPQGEEWKQFPVAQSKR